MPLAHGHPRGERGHRQVGVQVLADPPPQRAQILAAAGRVGQGNAELALAARPLEVHDHDAGDFEGDLVAVVLGHECQGEIHGRSDAGARPHTARADEDGIGVDLDGGVIRGEPFGRGPVGGRPVAVEQTGGGGHLRAHAHRSDPARGRSDLTEPGHHGGIDLRFGTAGADSDPARHHQRVDRALLAEQFLHVQAHSGGGRHRTAPLTGQVHLVAAADTRVVRPQHEVRHGEDLGRTRHVERVDPGEHREHDHVGAGERGVRAGVHDPQYPGPAHASAMTGICRIQTSLTPHSTVRRGPHPELPRRDLHGGGQGRQPRQRPARLQDLRGRRLEHQRALHSRPHPRRQMEGSTEIASTTEPGSVDTVAFSVKRT